MKIPIRLVLAFFGAYGLNTTLHEFAHALMAHLLGLRATMFHWYVNIDYPAGDIRTRVLCAIAGPVFSLGLGTVFWVMYKRFQAHPAGLLLLYSSILGISIFLGNLFSTSFVEGDFGVTAAQLDLPAGVRLAMTLAGGLLLAGFLYRMGPELLKWAAPEPGRLRTTMKVIVWPVVLGTALVVVAYLPLPSILSWIASQSFWIFAAAGAAVAQRHRTASNGRDQPVQAADLATAAGVLLVVRVLVRGITFVP